MKRTPLRRVSKKQAVRLSEYEKKRDDFLRFWTYCEFPGCKHKATDIHHKNGRSGTNLYDTTTFMALCREHHSWIENHKNEARKKGWITYK